MRYLLILILFSGCSPSKQFAKLAIAHPELPAKYCVDKYEGKKDTVYRPGTEKVTFDTIYFDGETRIDTVISQGRPIEITKTILLPGKTIYERSIRVDTVYRPTPELLAKLDLCDIERRSAILSSQQDRKEMEAWKKKAKRRFWIILALCTAIGIGLFLKLRKSFAGLKTTD